MNAEDNLTIPLLHSRTVDYFVSPNDASAPPSSRLRARLLVLSLLLLVAWAPLNAAFYLAINASTIAIAVLAMTAASVIPLYISRRSGRHDIIGHYVAVTSLATLILVILDTGGLESLAVYWLAIVPIYAHVFIGRKAALGWAGTAVCILFGLALATSQGAMPTSDIPREMIPWINLFSSISFIGLATLLFALNGRLREVAERRLRDAQARMLEATRKGFHKLIEHSPDGILVHRDASIRYANPAAVRLLGLEDTTDVAGKPLERFVDVDALPDPDDSGEFGRHSMKQTKVEGEDGHEVPVELTQFVAPVDGEYSVITVLRDLSERLEMRAQMMRMDRMAAIGTLAAGVGHEINNPLAFVMGNLEIVREDLEVAAAEHDFSGQEMLASIDDAIEGSERIKRIVADLRTYARDESREHEPTDVRESLESAIKMAKNELRHRATLVRDFSEVPHVMGDESLLGQVFLNLLINAAQAVPVGDAGEDSITVRVRHEDGRVLVSVSDTGQGIDPDHREHIFDPFYTTKSFEEGTGLGLAVCKNIVEDLDGEIRVDSTPGEGATFTVDLPACEVPAAEDGDADQSTLRESIALRVLVVDDQDRVCKMIARMLGEDCETYTFNSAGQAIEALSAGLEVDVVLSDLLMPEMSGIQFYEQLCDVAPQLVDHIAFMTGGAFTQEARTFQQDTNNPIVNKPFEAHELLDVLRETARQNELTAAS
jgi:PAS domain S-box-containing protein